MDVSIQMYHFLKPALPLEPLPYLKKKNYKLELLKRKIN